MDLRNELSALKWNDDGTLDRIMMETEEFSYIVSILHRYGIKGNNIKRLYRDCCGSNRKCFIRTINFFATVGLIDEEIDENKDINNCLTRKEIINNLESGSPIAFLSEFDMGITVPNIDQPFGPNYPNWNEYCHLQLIDYKRRLKERNPKCA